METIETTKHTAGPWNDTYRFTPNRKNLEIQSAPGTLIAKVTPLYQQAEAEANARLIAAAPELLEACKEVLVWFDDYQNSNYYDGYTCDEEEKMMKATIAKAIGAQKEKTT